MTRERMSWVKTPDGQKPMRGMHPGMEMCCAPRGGEEQLAAGVGGREHEPCYGSSLVRCLFSVRGVGLAVLLVTKWSFHVACWIQPEQSKSQRKGSSSILIRFSVYRK